MFIIYLFAFLGFLAVVITINDVVNDKFDRSVLMNKPTRFYSSKQEKKVAKEVGGKQVANSGATRFNKGDVVTDNWLIECKTKITPSQSITIRKEWLEKNKEEAFAMNKLYSALSVDFGDGKNYYIIEDKIFSLLVELLKEAEE